MFNMVDVENWLAQANLLQLRDIFRQEAIERIDQICALTEDDARELGLKIGVRKRLLHAIAVQNGVVTLGQLAKKEEVIKCKGEKAIKCNEGFHRSELISSPGTPIASCRAGCNASKIHGVRIFEKKLGHFQDLWDGTVPAAGRHLQIDESRSDLIRLLNEPPIFICEEFLTLKEVLAMQRLNLKLAQPTLWLTDRCSLQCDELVAVCQPLLTQSKTNAGISELRTSRSCSLDRSVGVAPALLQKASKLTGKPTNEIEVSATSALLRVASHPFSCRAVSLTNSFLSSPSTQADNSMHLIMMRMTRRLRRTIPALCDLQAAVSVFARYSLQACNQLRSNKCLSSLIDDGYRCSSISILHPRVVSHALNDWEWRYNPRLGVLSSFSPPSSMGVWTKDTSTRRDQPLMKSMCVKFG